MLLLLLSLTFLGVSGQTAWPVTTTPLLTTPPPTTPRPTTPPPPPTSDQCQMEDSVIFMGLNVATKYPVHSPEDCCALCREDPECFYWTYCKHLHPTAARKCFLKSEKTRAQSGKWYISGAKPPPVPTPPPPPPMFEQCLMEFNMNYLKLNLGLPVTEVDHPEDCCALCQKNPECFFWSYTTNANPHEKRTCFLKSGKFRPVSTRHVVSGAKPPPVLTTPPPPPIPTTPDPCQMEENINYKGFNLGQPIYPVYYPEDCCAHCRENPECLFWTYGTNANAYEPRKCFLKTGKEAASGRHVFSGAKPPPVPTTPTPPPIPTSFASCQMEDQISIAGGKVESGDGFFAEDEFECCARCTRRTECKFWSFIKPSAPLYGSTCWMNLNKTMAEENENAISGTKRVDL